MESESELSTTATPTIPSDLADAERKPKHHPNQRIRGGRKVQQKKKVLAAAAVRRASQASAASEASGDGSGSGSVAASGEDGQREVYTAGEPPTPQSATSFASAFGSEESGRARPRRPTRRGDRRRKRNKKTPSDLDPASASASASESTPEVGSSEDSADDVVEAGGLSGTRDSAAADGVPDGASARNVSFASPPAAQQPQEQELDIQQTLDDDDEEREPLNRKAPADDDSPARQTTSPASSAGSSSTVRSLSQLSTAWSYASAAKGKATTIPTTTTTPATMAQPTMPSYTSPSKRPPSMSEYDDLARLASDKRMLEAELEDSRERIVSLNNEIVNLRDSDQRRTDQFGVLQEELAAKHNDYKEQIEKTKAAKAQIDELFKSYAERSKAELKARQDAEIDAKRAELEREKMDASREEAELRLTHTNEELEEQKRLLKEMQGRIEELTAANIQANAEREAALLEARGVKKVKDELESLMGDGDDFLPSGSRTPSSFGTGGGLSDTEGQDRGGSLPGTPTKQRKKSIRRLTMEKLRQKTEKEAGDADAEADQDERPEDVPGQEVTEATDLKLLHPKHYGYLSNHGQTMFVGAVLGAVLVALLLSLAGWGPGASFPARFGHGYHYYGAYNDGRRVLGLFPVGFGEGSSMVHGTLMAIERMLAVPEMRLVL